MNFLDKTGLTYFWSKIKDYITSKKYVDSPDESIKHIVELTYDEYQALETIDPDTEYHIKEYGTGGSIESIVNQLIQADSERKHPVGSLEFNTSGDNPATYLGFGTWELWGSGKVPIGVDSSDSSIDEADKTTGSKTKSYTPAGNNTGTAVTLNAVELTHSGGAVQSHTLTAAESGLPSHTHTLDGWAHGDGKGYSHVEGTTLHYFYNQVKSMSYAGGTNASSGHSHGFTQPSKHSFTPTTKTVTNPTFTGTQANINVVQPSIACYMWKRIS